MERDSGIMEKESYLLMEEILLGSGTLSVTTPYEKAVTREYAEKATR